jgi:hypothetical protein
VIHLALHNSPPAYDDLCCFFTNWHHVAVGENLTKRVFQGSSSPVEADTAILAAVTEQAAAVPKATHPAKYNLIAFSLIGAPQLIPKYLLACLTSKFKCFARTKRHVMTPKARVEVVFLYRHC